MKKLAYQIDINAPVSEVWNKMLSPDGYVEWTSVSWPGSFYEGRWAEGEKLRFISDDGSGLLAEMKELVPYKTISMEHVAVLTPGRIEDRDSDIAKSLIGTREAYSFRSVGPVTNITVDITTNPDWANMFDEGWPPALKKLKEICEERK